MHLEHLILDFENLGQEQKHEVLEHIKTCQSCYKLYVGVMEFENAFKKLSIVKAPPKLDIIIMQRIKLYEMRKFIVFVLFVSISFALSVYLFFKLISHIKPLFIFKIYTYIWELLKTIKIEPITQFQFFAFFISLFLSALIFEFFIFRNIKEVKA